MEDNISINKKKEYKKFFNEDKKDVTSPPSKKQPKKGKVELITPLWVFVNVKGNGERIKFNAEEHKSLKVGDEIEI